MIQKNLLRNEITETLKGLAEKSCEEARDPISCQREQTLKVRDSYHPSLWCDWTEKGKCLLQIPSNEVIVINNRILEARDEYNQRLKEFKILYTAVISKLKEAIPPQEESTPLWGGWYNFMEPIFNSIESQRKSACKYWEDWACKITEDWERALYKTSIDFLMEDRHETNAELLVKTLGRAQS